MINCFLIFFSIDYENNWYQNIRQVSYVLLYYHFIEWVKYCILPCFNKLLFSSFYKKNKYCSCKWNCSKEWIYKHGTSKFWILIIYIDFNWYSRIEKRLKFCSRRFCVFSLFSKNGKHSQFFMGAILDLNSLKKQKIAFFKRYDTVWYRTTKQIRYNQCDSRFHIQSFTV